MSLQRAPQHRAQVLPLDQLHRQKDARVFDAEVVHRRDRRMRQMHRQADLVEEHVVQLGDAAEVGQDALERHVARDVHRPVHAREEHLGHAAAAEPLEELITPVLRHCRARKTASATTIIANSENGGAVPLRSQPQPPAALNIDTVTGKVCRRVLPSMSVIMTEMR